MTQERDDRSGKFTEQYASDEFLEAIGQIDHATTSEVATAVGCSYDLAYRRLNALADGGVIKRTEIGATFIWEID